MFESFLYVTIKRVAKEICAVTLRTTCFFLTLPNEASLAYAEMAKFFRMIVILGAGDFSKQLSMAASKSSNCHFL